VIVQRHGLDRDPTLLAAVKDARCRGLNLRQIAQECRYSVATVWHWVKADRLPPERRGDRRGRKVEPHAVYLRWRLAEGSTNQPHSLDSPNWTCSHDG